MPAERQLSRSSSTAARRLRPERRATTATPEQLRQRRPQQLLRRSNQPVRRRLPPRSCVAERRCRSASRRSTSDLRRELPTGVAGTFELNDFPSPARALTIQWAQDQQNFVIVDTAATDGLQVGGALLERQLVCGNVDFILDAVRERLQVERAQRHGVAVPGGDGTHVARSVRRETTAPAAATSTTASRCLIQSGHVTRWCRALPRRRALADGTRRRHRADQRHQRRAAERRDRADVAGEAAQNGSVVAPTATGRSPPAESRATARARTASHALRLAPRRPRGAAVPSRGAAAPRTTAPATTAYRVGAPSRAAPAAARRGSCRRARRSRAGRATSPKQSSSTSRYFAVAMLPNRIALPSSPSRRARARASPQRLVVARLRRIDRHVAEAAQVLG